MFKPKLIKVRGRRCELRDVIEVPRNNAFSRRTFRRFLAELHRDYPRRAGWIVTKENGPTWRRAVVWRVRK